MADLLNNANAANGMMTNIWGPTGWVFLHAVTFGYPMDPQKFDEDNGLSAGTTAERYRSFFEACGFVFPCRYCRESYQQFIIDDPVANALENRESLTRWLWRIHERVNQKLEKKGITYEELVERYEAFRAKCDAKKKGCSIPLGNTLKQKSCVVIYSELSVWVICLSLVMLGLFFWYMRSRSAD